MKKTYTKANRKTLIGALKESNIDRRIDKMNLYQEHKYFLLDDAKAANKPNNYKHAAKTTIRCKIFVTNKSGVYGYQFLAAIWISADGQWYQASGSMTGGCGYDKVSSAVDSAIRALGLSSDIVDHFGGTGQHEEVLSEIMGVIAGRRAWFKG